MSSMFNPPHPGLTLRDDILPALNLQVGEAATQLGVDRTTLSKVLNGRAAISPAMALRIERWLGRDHGGAAEVWLAQQAAHDLWQARATAKAGNTLSKVRTYKFRAASVNVADIAPVGQTWNSFFLNGPAVSDDFLPERESQNQPEREAL